MVDVSGNAKAHFSFSRGRSSAGSPASFADWNLRIGETASPTGPGRTLARRRARRTQIRDFLALPFQGYRCSQKARDSLAFVRRKRRRLLFHDAAFERLLNGRRRHGLQRGYLWNPSAGSGLGVVAGGTMFLKKLRGVRIVGRERCATRTSDRHDQNKTTESHRYSSFGILHLPTMCSTSFSFSVQTYSPMSSPASSSEARRIFQGFA